MGTTTTNLGLYKPAVGETGWGTLVDANFDTLDAAHLPVFDIRAYGASTGATAAANTTAINAAITAIPSSGGVLYTPPGVFSVTAGSIVLADREGITLMGVGPVDAAYFGAPTKGSVWKATAGTGWLLDWHASSSAQTLRGNNIRGMAFDCNSVADGLNFASCFWAGEVQLAVYAPLVTGVNLTTVNLSGVEDVQWNTFKLAVSAQANAAAKGVKLSSWAAGGGNISVNTFQTCLIYTQNGTGLEVGDTDHNLFQNITLNRSGTAVGVDLLGSGTLGGGHARHNVFVLYEGPGPITARATGLTQASGPNFVLWATGNSTSFPTIEPGAALTILDDTGRLTNGGGDYHHELFMKDDFACGSSSGTFGELNWAATGGSPSLLSAVAGHPGILHLDTTSTITTFAYAAPGSANSLWVDDLFDFTFVCRINTNDTDTQVRAGICGNPAATPPGGNGVYFEKLYADTSWFGVTRYAATQTRSSAIASTSTNWVTLRVRRINSTTIGFTVDGGTETTQATNVATGLVQIPFVQIENQTAASKTFDLDYFEMRVSGLSRT